jgi:DNA-binding response OmpR family regulator
MFERHVSRSRDEAPEVQVHFMMTKTAVSRGAAREDGGARVLLVEDDHELREALAENLRLNGIDVTEADSGGSFRKALHAGPIDVAIIDVHLPDATGFELTRELADHESRPGVIILTARTGRQDRRQGYAEGADLYMTKPVDGEELLFAVRNLARRVRHAETSAAPRETAERAWKLDMVRNRLVSPDDTFITLTGREVLLLEQFVMANGEPVSRAALAAVMGYGDPGPENRGLDAALRRLREKASARNIDLPLLVIHSVGIRFVSPFRLA